MVRALIECPSRVRASRVTLTVATALGLVLSSCSDPAHDPETWEGVPWALRDARLPGDRASIRNWFEAVGDEAGVSILPPFTIHQGKQVILELGFGKTGNDRRATVDAASVVPDEDGLACSPMCETHLMGCDPCTAADMMRALSSNREPVLESLDPSAAVWFIAAATDIESQSGYRGTRVDLWFAAPDGEWVFRIESGDVQSVRSAAKLLVNALSASS